MSSELVELVSASGKLQVSHGNRFSAHFRPRRLLKMLLFLLLLISCVIIIIIITFFFFLQIGVHWIFFCLNALWNEGAVLSAYEVRDVCCRWHRDWMVFCMAGKKIHIWNICRMHMKNFIRNARHIWILKEEKETRSMKRINQLRSRVEIY